MNMKLTIAALSLVSVIAFDANAATLIDATQAQNRQSVGIVSVSETASSPMDMNQILSQKAEEQGASAYRIIEARSGNTWHATAELYK